MTQPINDRTPIINPDGTPTQFFIRQLQERGITVDNKISLEELMAILAGIDIDVTAPLTGGGAIDADVTIGMADSGVTPGSYTNTNLTVDQFGRITTASNGSGGGSVPWYWDPPLASSFSTMSGDVNSITLSDDADVGMLYDGGAPVGGNVGRIAYRTLTTPANDWEMVVHFALDIIDFNRLIGLAYHDTVSGRTKFFGFRFDSTDLIVRSNINILTSGATISSTNVGCAKNPTWLRLSKVGANITGYMSGNGKQWSTIYTESVTAYLTNAPDRVGLMHTTGSTSGGNPVFAVDHFSLTGTAV